MDKDKIYKKYRLLLLKAYLIITGIIVVLEVQVYFRMKADNLRSTMFDSYFLFYMLLPLIINLLIILGAWLIHRSPRFSADVKNSAVIYALLLMALNIACIHGYFLAVMSVFALPVAESSIFSDKTLVKKSTVLAIVFLVVSTFVMKNIEYHDSITLLSYNMGVGIVFILAAFFLANVIVGFNMEMSSELRSSIVRRKDLEEELQRDKMTGAYNEKAFLLQLSLTVSEARTKGLTPILAVLDIDNFMKINNVLGHEKGNLVLYELARILERHCSRADKVYRYGGEEFAVIFEGKLLEEVCDAMKRVQHDFACLDFGVETDKLTFSCGVCKYNGIDSDKEFFDKTDTIMYDVKKNGKDAIKVG